jgi:uncharacterized membrane protein YdjX (TVP38/TMEM64 family)
VALRRLPELFEALAENREALIAFRDANYIGDRSAFVAIYALIVAFSLPGATVATLTGGFLFATFPGALFNIAAATLGATPSSSRRRRASAQGWARGWKARRAWSRRSSTGSTRTSGRCCS